MAEKKKDPKFGGKRSLKDTSGNQKIGFEDTFLGDLLGFDGKMGTKGKPGLLASLKGARRKKPNLVQVPSKKPAVKKKDPVKKKNVTKPDLQAFSGSTDRKAAPKRKPSPPKPDLQAFSGSKNTPKPGRKINMTVPKKKAKIPEGRGIDSTVPGKGGRFSPENKERLVKKMKTITLEAWEALTVEQKVARGLPKNNREVMSLTGAFQKNARKFSDAFKANRGGLAKKKPVAKMNKGGMTKKSGYAAGGMPMVMKAGKKVPSFAADGVGKMNMGGMAKKKPAAKMMAGGMAKKKPTAKMMGGGMAKSGYMYGGSVTKKKPVTKMNKGGMTKKK